MREQAFEQATAEWEYEKANREMSLKAKKTLSEFDRSDDEKVQMMFQSALRNDPAGTAFLGYTQDDPFTEDEWAQYRILMEQVEDPELYDQMEAEWNQLGEQRIEEMQRAKLMRQINRLGGDEKGPDGGGPFDSLLEDLQFGRISTQDALMAVEREGQRKAIDDAFAEYKAELIAGAKTGEIPKQNALMGRILINLYDMNREDIPLGTFLTVLERTMRADSNDGMAAMQRDIGKSATAIWEASRSLESDRPLTMAEARQAAEEAYRGRAAGRSAPPPPPARAFLEAAEREERRGEVPDSPEFKEASLEAFKGALERMPDKTPEKVKKLAEVYGLSEEDLEAAFGGE
jgi:hypothetical protein